MNAQKLWKLGRQDVERDVEVGVLAYEVSERSKDSIRTVSMTGLRICGSGMFTLLGQLVLVSIG